MNFIRRTYAVLLAAIIASCQSASSEKSKQTPQRADVQLITLDPGHFHAALVQKSTYPGVDSVVHVYAPEGPDVALHLEKIRAYNERPDNPTHWREEVYRGNNFLEKMLADKAGNVIVMSGNNRKKTEYIKKSVDAGFHVLADKPMAIDAQNFALLKEAFAAADKNNVLLYDIMTERHEITTRLQREFSMLPAVFGTLEKGSPDNPSVTKESVHHFYKFVSGSALTRPAWFMDVNQQGEGIVDVTTHLVDLIQWECFPEKIINYEKDIQIGTARRWTTDMTRSQFKALTKQEEFPEYLKKNVTSDSVLSIYSNGEINYRIRGVHAKVSVIWAYQAPEGTGDTHYSIMRGTKANLIIRQGADQQYKPTLYIEPVTRDASYGDTVTAALKTIQATFPGVALKKIKTGWEVVIPEKYKEGHEAHFARVTENFLQYLKAGKLPDWEVPNMIAKYYTTTRALEIAKQNAGSKASE